MKANKIILNNEVLLDLTGDTVAADKLVKGITAHDKSGNVITGVYEAEIPEIKLQEKEATENGEVVSDPGYDGLSKVTVKVPVPDGYIQPVGTKEIEENGSYNVAEYESVLVDVPAPVVAYYEGDVTISGGETLISFTIAGDAYEAENGMTWSEWVTSDYNTGDASVQGTLIKYQSNYVSTDGEESGAVTPTDIISAQSYSLWGGTTGGGMN